MLSEFRAAFQLMPQALLPCCADTPGEDITAVFYDTFDFLEVIACLSHQQSPTAAHHRCRGHYPDLNLAVLLASNSGLSLYFHTE